MWADPASRNGPSLAARDGGASVAGRLSQDSPLSRSRLRRLAGDPAVLLALVLAGAGLVEAWDLGRRSAGLDFYQFWVVAQVAGREDVPNVYGDEARARVGEEFVQRSLTDEDSERRRVVARPWKVLEPTATPLLYTAFRPLSGGTYEGDYRAFRLLSLAACAAGLVAIARLLGHGSALALIVLAFVAHSFQPLKSDIRVGNVNEAQLGVIAACLWLSSRDDRSRLQIAAGALLALLVVFKPNLLPLVPVLAVSWFLRGRRRKLALQAIGLAVGAALGALLPLLTFGTLQAWPDWFAYLTALPASKIPLRFGNMGLARLLFEATDVDLAPLLAAAALGAVLACLWLGRRRGADDPPQPAAVEDTAALAAGCLVYLLSSPMVWLHYMLLALPAALVLLRENQGGGRAVWQVVLTVLALVGIALDPVADLFGVRDLRHQALITSLALLALFVLLCLEMARGAALPRPVGGTTILAGGAP